MGQVTWFAETELPSHYTLKIKTYCCDEYTVDVGGVTTKDYMASSFGRMKILIRLPKHYINKALDRGVNLPDGRTVEACEAEHIDTFEEVQRFEWTQNTIMRHWFVDGPMDISDTVSFTRITR